MSRAWSKLNHVLRQVVLTLVLLCVALTPAQGHVVSIPESETSMLQRVVALGLADAQNEIGGLFEDGANGGEGSIGHILLHGLAGCAAAEAQGADCAAGAAGGIAQAVYAGGLVDTTKTDETQRNQAEVIGALVGWVFSQGQSENVSAASSIALSGLLNNRQLHRDEQDWIRQNEDEFLAFACSEGYDYWCSRPEEILSIFASGALELADAAFASVSTTGSFELVQDFIEYQKSQNNGVSGGASLLNISAGDRANSAMNVQFILHDPDLYAAMQMDGSLELAIVLAEQDRDMSPEDFQQFSTAVSLMSDEDIKFLLGQFSNPGPSFAATMIIDKAREDDQLIWDIAFELAAEASLENTEMALAVAALLPQIMDKIRLSEPLSDDESEFAATVILSGIAGGATGSLKSGGSLERVLMALPAVKRLRATNTAGVGRYTPSQPLDAAGNPIVRTNDRGGVLVQPNGSVTCGQHACGMVLNTQGRPVAVDDIISSRPPDFVNGSSQTQLQRALRDNGVGSTAFSGRTVEDLGRYTSGGRPAIATVQTGPNSYHAVVVDGVTRRGGQQVVAIRDPAGGTNGGVYYETVSSFQTRFTGDVIRMNNQ